MLVEPDLDRRELAAALDRHHGLAPLALRFVPAGETAWCYRLTDRHGGRWFLKLSRPAAADPDPAEATLMLADALAEQGLPVPRPRPTRSGQPWCWLAGLRLAVFELVDGDPLDDRALADPGMAGRVARLVAAIHAANPAPAVPVPSVERFEVAADELGRRLAALDPQAGAAADGLAAEARALVWPQRRALLDLVGRVQDLGAAAGAPAQERVLCHGDLIGDNLLVDRAGRLWVVDWDAARLAPRELDLALFTGPGFGRFLAAYEADAGPCDLDPDLVAFVLLRRNLDDLADWLGAVLDGDRPEPQRRADLDGVGWCLSRRPELEARIDRTRRLLAGRRRTS
jgi:spectinomycin phosphotransferase